MSDGNNENEISIPEVYSPTAIPLSKDFDFIHAPYSDMLTSDGKIKHFFIGREHIAENLAALLASKSRKRGSYLIAGYRGVGKTSVVNYAIKKFKKVSSDKKKVLEVRLNLGDKSQLTPLDVYLSIAGILRKEIKRKSSKNSYRSSQSSEFPEQTERYSIFFVSSSLAALFLFTFGLKLSISHATILVTLALLIFTIATSFILLINSLIPRNKAKKALNNLLERMTSEINEAENSGVSHYVNFNFSKHKKKLPINIREVEEELSWIIGELEKYDYKVIIVLDELDKLSDESEIAELKSDHQSNPQEAIKVDLTNDLLSSLKSFITTTHATFFFISGRETLDKYYSEKGSPNSLYESLFDRVFEVPSMLTDQETTSQGTQITKLVEEYVCCRLLVFHHPPCKCPLLGKINNLYKKVVTGNVKEPSNAYQSVSSSYSYSLKKYQEILKGLNTGNDEEKNKLIRRQISILRDFIYYLTFHSWGNPKRLSSLFETFIVPEYLVDCKLKENWLEKKKTPYWLVFNINHLRSFSLAAELTGLFMHQLSREVSSISDKLTVSTFSAIHFILKFHSHGFRRSSLQRLSETIGMYRSPEFNPIVNDLLAHTFNPYIRTVRNGIYRYRFHLGIEQELRYISHVSDLESVTYNSSLDSMKYAKQSLKNIIGACDNKETSVIAGVHIALGEICAIEQSDADATVHYNIACSMLLKLLNNDDPADPSVHHNTLLQCIEVMLKQGDLEEHKQNFNNAGAIYFEAGRIVERFCNRDKQLQENLKSGSLKWILLKQPFWACHFLSLKRSAYSFDHSPVNKARIAKPDYLYSENDQNFYHTAATLYFFAGYVELTKEHYETTKIKIDGNKISQDEYDERVAFLKGDAQIGEIENNLLAKSHDFFNILKERKEDNSFNDLLSKSRKFFNVIRKSEYENKGNTYFNKLFDFIKKQINNSEDEKKDTFRKVADDFEKNGLYVNAAITHIKAISYYTAILDSFHDETFSNEKEVAELKELVEKFNAVTIEKGRHAIRCINKARRLDSGHNNKRLLISSLDNEQETNQDIAALFEMLLNKNKKSVNAYSTDEEVFWQHSLWAQKLASVLLWARYVGCKITGIDSDPIFNKLPRQLSSLASRPAILICWVQARWLYQGYISKKLLKLKVDGKDIPTSARKILMDHQSQSFLYYSLEDSAEKFINGLELKNILQNDTDCEILKVAYHISRNLYFAHAHSRIISRKNFDLIFPRLPQIYYVQWKLLLNLIITMWVKREKSQILELEMYYYCYEEYNPKLSKLKLSSIRDFSYLLQRRLVAMDEKEAPHQRIPPSHFDYEYIHLRLCEALESSINLINNTSNSHKAIFQNKFFCHDDYNDPEFHTDYMLANMFTPSALLYKKTVDETHEKLYEVIRGG